MNPIPAKDLQRYRAVVQRAEHPNTPQNERNVCLIYMARVEKRHPGIRAALDRQLAAEAAADAARHAPPPPQPQPGASWAGLPPGFDDSTIYSFLDTFMRDQFGTDDGDSFAETLLKRGAQWGLDQLQQATDEEDDVLLSLEDKLEIMLDLGEVEIEPVTISNWHDDDNGSTVAEDCITLSLTLPETVWQEVLAGKGKPRRLLVWLDALLNDA